MKLQLVNDKRKAQRLIAKPTFESYSIINDSLTMIRSKKTTLRWMRPTIVGVAILEISKLIMYRFHYDKILRMYGDRAKLLFTDTDSLCYHITTGNVYNDMSLTSDWYDFSDYPKEHPLYLAKNKKELGKFKDETNSVPIAEWVGLRSKLYSMKLVNGKTKETLKGVKRSFVKKHISHEHRRN